MSVYLCGAALDDEKKVEIESMIAIDDGRESLGDAPEVEIHPPVKELPYRKLSDGFIGACAELLKIAMYVVYPVKCNHYMLVHKLTNGNDRIYIYNKYMEKAYSIGVVDSEMPIESAEVASAFPILPVKFVDAQDDSGFFDYSKSSITKKCFQVRLAPDGLTIVDIKRK
jgi:hypothetical protein